jgi:hypothetical protein
MAVEDFAIGNEKVEVTKQALMKIGKSKAYTVRKDFLNNLRVKAATDIAISTMLRLMEDLDREYEVLTSLLLYNLHGWILL